MSLVPGTRLGPYDVLAAIGAGGMGEVYRARDTKLNRDVALKVLPDAFAQDAERMARFQREAHVLASLNHPNIAAIYGLEEADDTRALVLELVEGPTLADRIAQGPIPVDEALSIAKQVAEALEAAHEQGVIHRDLKPANIKLRPDGTVKLLDFGLAKALGGEQAEVDQPNPPTLTAAVSQMGIILGSAAYMSPEQARGHRVDRRSDIWALGVVIYEMLTGRHLFLGDDTGTTLSNVLQREPDWGFLPSDLPGGFARFLTRCLVRDPRGRVHDAGDIRLALEGAFEIPASAARMDGASLASPGRMAVAGLCGSLLTLGTMWAVGWVRSTPHPPIVRSSLTPPRGAPFGLDSPSPTVALTPDGSRVVYRASPPEAPGTTGLYVRALDALDAVQLDTGGARPTDPFISPDGAWVGFVDGGSLWRTAIDGGPVIELADVLAGFSRGASWGDDDAIVFAAWGPDGLWRVSATGGPVEALTTPDTERGEQDHLFPHVLPGSEAVLFEVYPAAGDEETHVAVLSLVTREYEVLLPGARPRYVASGHIVYSSDGTIWAVPFDLERLQLAGEPVPIERATTFARDDLSSPDESIDFDISDNGTLVYVRDNGTRGAEERALAWVDRAGVVEPVRLRPGRYYEAALSPEGMRVALRVNTVDTGNEIAVYDLDRGTLTQLTFAPEGDCCPTWTADGAAVVWASRRDGGISNIWSRPAAGDGQLTRLTVSPDMQVPYAWTSEGDTLLFAETLSPTADLFAWTEANGSRRLFETEHLEDHPALSPDGRWLAYQSNETGRFEVWVRPFPDVSSGGPWRVSSRGGIRPVWSPDGTELFFVSGQALWAVTVSPDPTFSTGDATLVLDGPFDWRTGFRPFDVSPDGRRFLVRTWTVGENGLELILVQNWQQELLERVPVP